MQLRTPRGGFVQCGGLGRFQRKSVDGVPGIGAWVGGGVAAGHALGVDEAALNFRGRPALFDCAVCALAAVGDGDGWGFGVFKQQLVVAGGFVFALVPGDRVVDGRRDDQAATGGVGAVEECLVVDPLVVAGGWVRRVNGPAPLEALLHGGAANIVSFG